MDDEINQINQRKKVYKNQDTPVGKRVCARACVLGLDLGTGQGKRRMIQERSMIDGDGNGNGCVLRKHNEHGVISDLSVFYIYCMPTYLHLPTF